MLKPCLAKKAEKMEKNLKTWGDQKFINLLDGKYLVKDCETAQMPVFCQANFLVFQS